MLKGVECMENDSKQNTQELQDLIETLIETTDLPEEWIRAEISSILAASHHENDAWTMDQLRSALLIYLESLRPSFESGEVLELEDSIPPESGSSQPEIALSKTIH